VLLPVFFFIWVTETGHILILISTENGQWNGLLLVRHQKDRPTIIMIMMIIVTQ